MADVGTWAQRDRVASGVAETESDLPTLCLCPPGGSLGNDTKHSTFITKVRSETLVRVPRPPRARGRGSCRLPSGSPPLQARLRPRRAQSFTHAPSQTGAEGRGGGLEGSLTTKGKSGGLRGSEFPRELWGLPCDLVKKELAH